MHDLRGFPARGHPRSNLPPQKEHGSDRTVRCLDRPLDLCYNIIMKAFLFQIIGGILSIYLAAEFIPGIEFIGQVKTLVLVGLAIGILNYIIKPILKIFFFPLRLLTLGLFGLVINIGIAWFTAHILFPSNIQLNGLFNLLELTLIIWIISLFFYSVTKD